MLPQKARRLSAEINSASYVPALHFNHLYSSLNLFYLNLNMAVTSRRDFDVCFYAYEEVAQTLR